MTAIIQIDSARALPDDPLVPYWGQEPGEAIERHLNRFGLLPDEVFHVVTQRGKSDTFIPWIGSNVKVPWPLRKVEEQS